MGITPWKYLTLNDTAVTTLSNFSIDSIKSA